MESTPKQDERTPGYPVILNGDHAEFEQEHASTPPKERPDWPLPSTGEDGPMERVEIPPEKRDEMCDGIECRDATIKLQDENIERLRGKVEEARAKAIEECARIAKEEAAEHEHPVDRLRCNTIALKIRALLNGSAK